MKKLVFLMMVLLGGLGMVFFGCSPADEDMDDSKPTPSVTIVSPANGATVNVAVITLSGTASISSPASISKVEVKLNDAEWQQADGKTEWSVELTLDEGTNTIVARATGSNGKTASSGEWIIYYDPSAPSVEIQSHDNGAYVNEADITLSGTAGVADPFVITSVEVKLNEEDWESATGTDSWSADLSLTGGDNTIIVRAHSDNEKSASVEWTINYVPTMFVSTTGDDANSGTTSLAPLKSIQNAISNAQDFGILSIYVAEGVYTPGEGLNTANEDYQYSGAFIDVAGLTILGGWNSSFTERNGKSELDAESGLYHVLWIDDVEDITIDGFVIRGGLADGVTSVHNSGAGIYINQGSGHTIQNTVISNNTADDDGGGVYMHLGTSHTMSGTISGNTSDNYGGGVYLAQGANHIISATVTDNTVPEEGGGVFVDRGESHTISGTISGNTSDNYGGGVYLASGTGHTVSGTISNNTAQYGGGVNVYYGSNHTISGTISGNTASWDGGGVFVEHGENHTVSGTISDNTANYGGGGVFVEYGETHIINATISGNTVNDGYGGGVYVIQGTSHTISGTISGNTADGYGGGVYVEEGTGHIISANITDNTVTGEEGGGVFVRDGTSHTITGTISGNTASTHGGGVYVEYGENHTINATITGNTANDWGGGVYVHQGTSHTISGTISGNTADLNGGGVYFYDTSANDTHTFDSPTIEDNTGYGVYRWDANSTPEGIGTIDWGNGNTPEDMNW